MRQTFIGLCTRSEQRVSRKPSMKLIGRTSREGATLLLSISTDPSLGYVRQKKNKKRLSEVKSFSLDEPLQGDAGMKIERATLVRSKTYDVPLPQKLSDHEALLERCRSSSSNLPKHNLTFHKIFREISEEEELTNSFTCALQKEVLYQGRLYISHNHLGFYCSMLRKEIKVLIPVGLIILVKKANTALLVPNALSVRTVEGDKYLFGSLRNREVCYHAVRAVCPNLQDGNTCSSPLSSSRKQNSEQNNILNSSHSDLEQIQQESDGAENCSCEAALFQPQIRKPSSFDEVDSNEQVLFGKGDLCKDKISLNASYNQWPHPRAMNVLLVIYMLLVLLLLFSSGYIGLRIMELENQLSIMGAWPKGEEARGS